MATTQPPTLSASSSDSTTPLLSSPAPHSPPSSPLTAAHLFSLVPGLCSGLLLPALVVLGWLCWTVVLPLLLLLLPSSPSSSLRAAALTLCVTGVLLLLLLTLPFPRTLLALRSTNPPSSPPFLHPASPPPASYHIHVTHPLVIINPTGGTRDNRQLYHRVIHTFLTSHSLHPTTHFTTHPRHAHHLAHTLPLHPHQCLIVVGGDGTLHEVVNGLLTRTDGSHPLPIALIPLGTGNAVGADLGTWDVEEALQRVVRGEVVWMDVNHLTSPSTVCPLDLYSVETITWGLIGTVAVQAELPLMRRLGHLRFDLCALLNVAKGFAAALHLRCPSLELRGEMVTVYLNNTQHFARLLRAAPRAVLDDGKMDVLLLERGSRSLLLALFLLLQSGAHVGGEGVRYLQEEEVWMKPGEGRGVINVDGEIVEFEGELSVRCVRKALPILMESQWRGRSIPGLRERPP